MLKFLRKIFSSAPAVSSANETPGKPGLTDKDHNREQDQENYPESIYCLVGNVVEEHAIGEEKRIVKGTKQFSGGTKVYCFPGLPGDDYEKVKVIGRARKSKRYIIVVTKSSYITNWRMSQVRSPFVIKSMMKNSGWTNRETDQEAIQKMAERLNNRNAG